jgi:hypothetical protein
MADHPQQSLFMAEPPPIILVMADTLIIPLITPADSFSLTEKAELRNKINDPRKEKEANEAEQIKIQ